MRNAVRINSVLLTVVLLFGCVRFPACAEEYTEARNTLEEGFAQEQPEIDLFGCDITTDALVELVDDMVRCNEQPWYVDSYSYTYDIDSNLVSKVMPVYLDPKIYDRSLYSRKLENILEETVFPGMSDWQIALSIHDYLAVHFVYDETLEQRDAYDLITTGAGVCMGYASVYQDLLELSGIDCRLLLSEEMNHAWNLVRIGGVWYHVDLTWNDPTTDCVGRAMHDYFMLSDAQISDPDHGHSGWDRIETAEEENAMSNAFWKGINSRICYESADVSYFRADEGTFIRIYRRDELTGQVVELLELDAGYVDTGSGERYHYDNYGLSLWNGRLYFSDLEHVYSVNTDGSDLTVEHHHAAQNNGTYIKGSMVDDGVIKLALWNHGGDSTWSQIALPNAPAAHLHDYQTRSVPASCTEDGYVLHICTCGDSFSGDILPAAGHHYGDGIPEGDMIRFTCIVCGESYTEENPVPMETNIPSEQETEVFPSQTMENTGQEAGEKKHSVLPVVGVILVLGVLFLSRRKKASRKKSIKRVKGYR